MPRANSWDASTWRVVKVVHVVAVALIDKLGSTTNIN